MYISSISSRLLLYDTNGWELKKTYDCYDGILRDISWSDDSKYILQVNSKGIVEILSASDHDVKTLQHIPIKDSWSASFHREGHRNVAIGTKNGNVMIWDTKNKSITKTFPSPSQQCNVNFVSYNAKNTSLAASMGNGDTVIYGLVSNIPVLTIKLSYSRSISAMKFHHETRSLLGLATDEGHVILRDISTNRDKALFENVHASPVSDITYSLINREVMLSSSYDKMVHVYDVRLQNVVSTIKTSFTLTSLAINPENLVAIGTKNGLVLIYDLRDLSSPFKVLTGHEEEVHKVAFQPSRKKIISADISLREEHESFLSNMKVNSPVRNRNSDVFFASDTPPKPSVELSPKADPKADSFLVMMGLDESNCEAEDDGNKISEGDKKSDRYEARYRHLDAEKNISKISTPLNSRMAENFAFSTSPLVTANGIPDDGRVPTINFPNSNDPTPALPNIDKNTIDELKDFVKLTLSDVEDDNRNYFLHIMMALTKQKLYLEKQMSNMNEKIDALLMNQSALVETNRILTLEIDQLKAKQNFF